MIELKATNDRLKFHNKIVSDIFDKIVNKKIGYENIKNEDKRKVDKKTFKLNDKVIEFLKDNKEDLIGKEPERLLELNKDYKNLGLNVTEEKKAKDFFCDVYKNHFQKYNGKAFLNYLDIETCIYCNRNYTLDLKNSNHSRAQLDHWFPKEKFPILVLSFYNLIPCCHFCNHIKLNGDEMVKKLLKKPEATDLEIYNWWINDSLNQLNHPYLESDSHFKFTFFYQNLNNHKVSLNFDKNTRTAATLEFNKIDEIYNTNSDKELKDLLDLRYKYSDNYIDILINKTFEGIMSKEEIYRMIFGIEIKEEDYHKRPFSKFKHDIIEELKNIK